MKHHLTQFERQERHPEVGRLVQREDAPAIVPADIVASALTYRQAVRLCWDLRRVPNETLRRLAAECGLVAQHVTDYFNPDDVPRRRDLPGQHVQAVEDFLGNTAISQWHAARAQLTVLEVLQAQGRAAA